MIASHYSQHRNAILEKPLQNDDDGKLRLGSSRAYSLSLSPKLLFTRSNVLPALVSSRVHEQLEFLAVGTWWIYQSRPREESKGTEPTADLDQLPGILRKIPGSREDIFADQSLPLRAQRSIIKLLKLAADPEEHVKVIQKHGVLPFSTFLSNEHRIPIDLQPLIHALTLSPDPPPKTSTGFALTNIHRHLTSIGLFGPGFSSVIPKWGGLSEIAQVGCRAGAVGGGVYVLGKTIRDVEKTHGVGKKEVDSRTGGQGQENEPSLVVKLDAGEAIRTKWLIGTPDDLPDPTATTTHSRYTSYTVSIIASPLSDLFPPPSENSPPPAASVVVFPSGVLRLESSDEEPESAPVYITVHSADSGECPVDQSKLIPLSQHD